MTKCIITEGTVDSPKVLLADVVIAHVKGEEAPKTPRNVRYENRETKEKYFCLAGGFAWPGMRPGFACVVAALEGPDPDLPTFKVVAEVGDTTVQQLIERAYALYEEYGITCRAIGWTWYGE